MTKTKINIHGYCPHCKADLDGDLVINYPLSQGEDMAEAVRFASAYAGFKEYGLANRWGRAIGVYDMGRDRTVEWECPDCKGRWPR